MMTEKLPSLSVTTGQNFFTPGHGPFTVPKVESAEDEEPYSIKCICKCSDDDGSTIYCETCDSWQHIDCYYPDSRDEALRDEFSHSCADCKPRPLDKQRAVKRLNMLHLAADLQVEAERQRSTHTKKKKPKPSEIQTNVNEGANQPSPADQHPAPKKTKTSHRPSQSTGSMPAKRSPSNGTSRPHHSHPLSPATTPPDLPDNFQIHAYSSAFCSLYKESHISIVHTNSFANLSISNTMSLWLREPDRMRQETGRTSGEVFEDLPVDPLKRSHVRVDEKRSPTDQGVGLHWRFLTTDAPVGKDVPLLELHGVIGFQKDYCADRTSFWPELTSPLPFVFFHPSLPLYIDTRMEGSEARYVRRSCRPNAQLGTSISDGSEYHFWLVSDRHISANEQITLPWDFRLPKKVDARWLQLLGLGEGESYKHEPDMTDEEYTLITEWVHRILSEYGGCACDLGSNCAFARFHRHHLYAKSHPKATKKKAAPRKTKAQAISPTSTSQATNSRAPSESQGDGGADNDARSTSERSKPPSRDRTPARQGSFDQPGILTELTDREKRKVAMAEDTFRRMEQQPPAKKKKRASDGTTNPAAKKPKASTTTNDIGGYADVGTSTARSRSHSPTRSVSPTVEHLAHARPINAPSARPKPVYVDAAVQTDPGPIPRSPSPCLTKPRKRIVSLTQRFITNRCQVKLEEERRRSMSSVDRSVTPVPMDIDSTGPSPDTSEAPGTKSSPTAPQSAATICDTSMPDTPAQVYPGSMAATADIESTIASPHKTKTELHVQLPPVPLFGQPNLGAASGTTPVSAIPSLLHSPFSASVNGLASPFGPPANGFVASPSPVKKKLSLSDYTKRNKVASKLSTHFPKPIHEDTKSADMMQSPAAEKATERVS